MSSVAIETVSLPPLGGVLDFLRMVWAVDHGAQSMSKRMEATLGVTGPQRLVIRLVGRFPGITAGQLAEVMRVHPSTMTGILKRLESKGLLSRRENPRDRRRSFLGLTEAGRTLKEVASGTVEAAVQETLERFPAEKVSAAQEILQALADALGRGVSVTPQRPASLRRAKGASTALIGGLG